MMQKSVEMFEWNRDNRRILKWKNWAKLNIEHIKMCNDLARKTSNQVSLKLLLHWKQLYFIILIFYYIL